MRGRPLFLRALFSSAHVEETVVLVLPLAGRVSGAIEGRVGIPTSGCQRGPSGGRERDAFGHDVAPLPRK